VTKEPPPRAPLVSVVVAARDYGKYLPAAIRSLTAQSFQNWDCVIVDDGSVDDTETVAADLVVHDPRVRYVRQPARGVSTARNTGLRVSRGPLVQFLDADDRLAEGKLDSQVRKLTDDPSIDVIYGSERPIRQDDTPEGLPLLLGPRPSGAGDEVIAAILAGNPMVMSAPLFRRSALDRVGGFDETVALNEDWDLVLRLALSGARFHFDPSDSSLSFVRMHTGSASSNRLRMMDAAIELQLRVGRGLINPAHRRISEEVIADLAGAAGILRVRGGDVRRGLRDILHAAKRRPRAKWFAALVIEPLRLLATTALCRLRAHRPGAT